MKHLADDHPALCIHVRNGDHNSMFCIAVLASIMPQNVSSNTAAAEETLKAFPEKGWIDQNRG